MISGVNRIINHLFPFIFGILSFIFYLFLYHPPLGSIEFTTALLVLLSAQSWSAMIIYPKKDQRPRRIYLGVTLLAPLLLLIIPKLKIDMLIHGAIYFLLLWGILAIYIYTQLSERKS